MFYFCIPNFMMHLFLLVVLGLLLGEGAWGITPQPNFVIILADDMGYNDIGYNNPDMHTPHLDLLAKKGRILTHSYFQSTCSPSRAALLTGKYPHTMQLEKPFQPVSAHCLPTDIKLLPEYLQDAGYTTHLVGKWHLGYCQPACLPNNRGFDSFDGFYNGLEDYYNHTDCEGFRHHDWRQDEAVDKTNYGEYVTELISEKADAILKAHDENIPFFMVVSHLAPHMPLQAPDHFTQMFNNIADPRRRTYMGQVAALDHEVGRLVVSLKSNGFYDNTIIFFSSDNGGEGFAGPADNGILRGTKATLFEGGVRVVSFVHSPLLINTNEENDGIIHVTDWFTTILSMANVHPSAYASQNADGIDQSEMLLYGAASNRTEVPLNINAKPISVVGHNAVRSGNYKLLWGYTGIADGYGRNIFIKCDPEHKIIPPGFDPIDDIESPYSKFTTLAFGACFVPVCYESKLNGNDLTAGEIHLYDVVADPGEHDDLYNKTGYESILANLQNITLTHLANFVGEPRVLPRPAAAVAALDDGTWATGWCNDLNITLT